MSSLFFVQTILKDQRPSCFAAFFFCCEATMYYFIINIQ
jgi:hypothetical protein